MSQSNSTPLGSRENYFAPDNDAYENAAGAEDGGHDEYPGVSRERYIAGSILRKAGDPTLLCPYCWAELEIQSPLSEPDDYVPASEVVLEEGDEDEDPLIVEMYADHRRHRHCTDPDCGMISWGGVLQDRSVEDFLDVVRHVLDFTELRDSEREAIVANAESRKRRNWSDESNMERVVHEIETGPDGG